MLHRFRRYITAVRTLAQAERWTEPYGPEVSIERVAQLVDACDFWHAMAIQSLDELNRLRGELTHQPGSGGTP